MSWLRCALISAAILLGPPAAAGQASQPPASAAAQAEWEKISTSAARLALDDKTAEAVAMVEAFLRRHPDVADAHFLQASLLEQLAGFDEKRTPGQLRDLERAAHHYGRAADLMEDPGARFAMIWKLAQLHGPDQLNRPAEAERLVRRLVEEHPTRPQSHMVYAQHLRAQGDIAAAAGALRKGRLLAPDMPIPGLLLLLQYVLEQVQSSRELPPDAARQLLDEAVAVTDAVIAAEGRDDRDYRLATMGKAMALELMAERVERDPRRRVALLADSRRHSAPIAEHVNGAPPAARPLTAQEAAEIEWEFLERWNARLVDEGRHADAAASYQKYLAARPNFMPAQLRLAEIFVRAKDTAAAVPHLKTLAGLVQGTAGLSPAVFHEVGALLGEAEDAFANIPDVLDARAVWLEINAARFETDPARVRALSDEAARLRKRAAELRRMA